MSSGAGDGPLAQSTFPSPLPIPAPVHGGAARHCKPHNGLDLTAVVQSPVVLAPRAFLPVTHQIGTCDMVVVANLATTEPAEKALCTVAVDAAWQAVGLAVVDPFDLVA